LTTQDAASIKTAILALLTNGVGLTAVKKWLKAEPSPMSYPTSPFGYVEWAGGPRVPEAGGKKVVDNFYVIIIKKSTSTDDNEDALIALCKAAEVLLEADNTLSGTTFDSYISNREVQKVPQNGNNEIAAVRLTVSTWRLV
jgi:hypothetical protein